MKRSFALLLIFCLTTSFASAAVIKGPYLIYPGTNTEMMVLWQKDVTQGCAIEWGENTSYTDGSAAVPEYGSDNQHKYTITSLTPGTKYYYRIDSNDNLTGSFYAAPANDANDVKLFAYGDTRNHADVQSQVTGRMITEYTEDPGYQTITLFDGDYVDRGRNETSWTSQWVNRSYSNLLDFKANMPINGARGNHENNIGAGDEGDLYLKYYPYPYVANKYWSFDYGPVHVAVLDQYTSTTNGDINTPQLTWLENDLAASNKKWKIILLHEPGYTGGTGESAIQDDVQPLCEQYGVQLLIAGDTHNYNRSVVNGITHITTGGGGAPLYGTTPWGQYVVEAEMVFHFCKIDIQGKALLFEAVRIDGSIIDSFVIDDEIATSPSPKNNAAQLSRKIETSWSPGVYAADTNGHTVYFGTSFQDVNDGTALVNDPCQPQDTNSYDPDIVLEPNTTYYWCVDEVNDACSPYLWPGYVWNFTTAGYVAIDDFEAYTDTSNLLSVWIKESTNSDMAVTLLFPLDTKPIYQGFKSIEFNYDNSNSPYYSEIERTFTESQGQDWTAGDVKALNLYFRGIITNDTSEQMYLRLEDTDSNSTTVIYGDDPKYFQDPNDLNGQDDEILEVTEWITWHIDLQDFNDINNVDLEHIKKIAIGFGNGAAPAGAATGTIYFDEIRLYEPRCIPELVPSDFTDDCQCDWKDLDILSDEWLKYDYSVYEFNAPLKNFPTNASQWVAGHDGNDPCALQFDGSNDWLDLDDNLLTDFYDKTITMWVRLDASNTGTDDMYIFGTGSSKQRLLIFIGGTASTYQGAGQNKLCAVLGGTSRDGSSMSNSMAKYLMTPGTWTHVAFKVISTGDPLSPMNDGRVYINGVFDVPSALPPTPRFYGPLDGANLGSYNDGADDFGQVTISDFRIYDEVLPDANIVAIYNGTDNPTANTPWLWYKLNRDDPNALIAKDSGPAKSVYYPLSSLANLYDAEANNSKQVNFKDFAIVAEKWLQGVILWP